MLGLDVLDKILNKPSLEIDQAQCLDNRYQRTGCTACVDACPAQALSYGTELHVQLEVCSACGICQGACPSGALTVTGMVPNTLLLKAKGKPVVEIACPRAQATGALQVPCLAALDPELLTLMGFLGTGEVILQDRACASCVYGAAERVRQLPERVRLLADAFGLGLQVTMGTAAAGQADATPADDGEAFARRELFTLFRRQMAEVTGILTEDWIFANHERPHGLPHRVSAKRLKLVEMLRQRPEQAVQNTRMPDRGIAASLDVDAQGCDACGLCAAICPTGAIRVERPQAAGGVVTLREQVAHCIDCGLCLKACPQGAIRRGEASPVAAWLDEAPRLLAEIPTHRCRSCGKPFTPSPLSPGEGGLCLRCSAERNLLDELFHDR